MIAAAQLEQQFRFLIDRHTLDAKLPERAACEFATEVLSSLLEDYQMRLDELKDEEGEEDDAD